VGGGAEKVPAQRVVSVSGIWHLRFGEEKTDICAAIPQEGAMSIAVQNS
jgi:hypothetical protein